MQTAELMLGIAGKHQDQTGREGRANMLPPFGFVTREEARVRAYS